MPNVIPYPRVLDATREIGLRCAYPNGGAFAFADAAAQSVGWVGPDDPTIRAEARAMARRVPPPYEANLSRLLVRAWLEAMPAPAPVAWLMPASHWAYELEFGSRSWMPELLARVGVDVKQLEARNVADAIAFSLEEADAIEQVARRLLESLEGSDFTVLFPPRAVLCALHHHKQIWWTSAEGGVLDALRAMT